MPPFRYGCPSPAHLASFPKSALGGALPSLHSLQEWVKQTSSLKGIVLQRRPAALKGNVPIPGNILEHPVVKTLPEGCAKYWTDASCPWPFCKAYYNQFLHNKNREKLWRAATQFELVLEGLTVFWLLFVLDEAWKSEVCRSIRYIQE